jgi:hypothetical protein
MRGRYKSSGYCPVSVLKLYSDARRPVSFIISADDPRSIRALEIAAEADHWLQWRTADGQLAFGVPSQSDPNHYYVVTPASCDCPDFRRNALDRPPEQAEPAEPRACKHMLAVRLYRELVRAEHLTRRR